eukprot:GHRR01016348.1.p1 GENE.GHRR01016348.1~~GHRR01016348.1.p1  ORF type:complete len:191 (+),score=25.58 GHRR01016348.1:134-706(+)
MGHPVAPSRRRRAWLNCFGCLTTKDMNNLAAQNGEPVTEPAPSGGIAAADVAKKGAASSSGSVAPVVTVAEVSSSSSGILAVYEPKLTNDVYSTDAAASTSYPQTTAGYHTDWKNLGVCMASARDMEACVDGVVRGRPKPVCVACFALGQAHQQVPKQACSCLSAPQCTVCSHTARQCGSLHCKLIVQHF